MHAPAPQHATAFYRAGERMRSRSVSDTVLVGLLDVPAPPPRLVADWTRDMAQQLALAPGDVEALALARARLRWPDYRLCMQAVADWTHALGLADLLAQSDVALMACRGARYHHDAAQYGGAAFCNLFLSEDRALDLHFRLTGQRIELRRGAVVLFDTGEPHAVIPRHRSSFDEADFPPDLDCAQVFLTWELPIETPALAHALGIAFDTAPATALQIKEPQLWRQGVPGDVCPHSGHWLAATRPLD